MDKISPLAWAFIIGVGVLVVGSYISLFNYLRNPKGKDISQAGKILQSMQTPVNKTDLEFEELSRRVRQLTESSRTSSLESNDRRELE